MSFTMSIVNCTHFFPFFKIKDRAKSGYRHYRKTKSPLTQMQVVGRRNEQVLPAPRKQKGNVQLPCAMKHKGFMTRGDKTVKDFWILKSWALILTTPNIYTSACAV